eukprot:859020-Rhodomonas_salina.1
MCIRDSPLSLSPSFPRSLSPLFFAAHHMRSASQLFTLLLLLILLLLLFLSLPALGPDLEPLEPQLLDPRSLLLRALPRHPLVSLLDLRPPPSVRALALIARGTSSRWV